MNQRSTYRLLVDLPMLTKGTYFVFYEATGNINWLNKGVEPEYPLRQGLAGYLWLLRTEREYMKLISKEED